MRIFMNRWFEKFARKQDISDGILQEAVERAERGLIDADLGGGVVKQRVAREGQGKSGGFRTVILFRTGKRAIFVFGFAKSDRANLSAGELHAFRMAAKIVLTLSDAAIETETKSGRLIEVTYGEDL
ncbi:MAG TPA: type II toxin-antitoxin system RelE/ParE family toxin [Allosphingosinicella sp.]|nr:type II toxin-antitoxin system RelE/ParE family toxin [Allosphingosinicella sp.]